MAERQPDAPALEEGLARAPVGRFAPSPTGVMHAGNIFAALMSWLIVRSQGGRMVLRIEDLDRERSKPAYADRIQRDLESLGLTWDEGPYFQHGREEAYRAAYERLAAHLRTYPCYCTRADLNAASAPHRGEKRVYPGTCRHLSADDRARREGEGRRPAWRVEVPARTIGFTDLIQGPYEQRLDADCGDFVVRRSDGAFAYQLAVVVDDAAQGVSTVVRGVDLLCSTPQQMLLQQTLGLPEPRYAHVPLVVAEHDRRLSKRDRDAGLDALMARYGTAEGVIGHIAGVTGLAPSCEPVSAESLLAGFDLDRWAQSVPDKVQIPWH